MMMWLALLLPVAGLWCLLIPSLRPQSHRAEEQTVLAVGFVAGLGTAIIGVALIEGNAPVPFLLAGVALAAAPAMLAGARRIRSRRLLAGLDATASTDV